MGSFEQARAIELPGWLADPTGDGYQRVLGRAQDVETRRLKDAVLASFPATAPADAAPLIGHDQDLEQAPGESTEDFLARCERALDIWYWCGTKRGIQEVFEPFGVPAEAVRVLDDHETTYADDGSGWWSRVWVMVDSSIDSSSGPWSYDGLWGSAGTWDDGGTWDTTMTIAELQYIRRWVRKFKSPGSYPTVLFLLLDAQDGGDGAWDDGVGAWDDGYVWDASPTYASAIPLVLGHVWGEEEMIYGLGSGLWDETGDVWGDFE